jgi:copper chaperone CopZ
MKNFFVAFLATVAFLAVSPTSVDSFLVSKGTPASISLRDQTSKAFYRKWGAADGRRDSRIALRGGNDSSGTNDLGVATKEIGSVRGSEAYYLVWSPGFLPKFAVAATFLAVIRRIGWDARLLGLFVGSLRSVPPGLFPNIVLPLLSSSCCAIQLAFNAVSAAVLGAGAGCLGFNTVLGPLRPYLMAIMAAYHTLPATAFTLFRYAVAILPELVFGWNEVIRSRWKKNSSEATGNALEPTFKATMVVEVPTMGCVACVNKIESSLRNCAPENIESASSWLNPKDQPANESGKKGGRAKIELKASSTEDLDVLSKRLVGAIEDAGFKGSTIEIMEIESK